MLDPWSSGRPPLEKCQNGSASHIVWGSFDGITCVTVKMICTYKPNNVKYLSISGLKLTGGLTPCSMQWLTPLEKCQNWSGRAI